MLYLNFKSLFSPSQRKKSSVKLTTESLRMVASGLLNP